MNGLARLVRADLHCHSYFSKDSSQSLESIISACQRRGISILALTDHNEVAGAFRLREMAPDWLTVIVGEEITTLEGDLIGLYLTNKIPGNLSMTDTIERIHAMGGLVVVPHPFDRLRRQAMGAEQLARVKNRVDFVEVFNARNVFEADNRSAQLFAQRFRLAGVAASDAHWPGELGNATCLIESPDGSAADLAAKLRQARLETSPSGALVHAGTAIVKQWKRFSP